MADIKSLVVNIEEQILTVFDVAGEPQLTYPIASAANGIGQQHGSECTPLGSHRIRAKIGSGAALNTVFVGRRATGEVYSDELALKYPSRDWILTRILWLCGNEPGVNRLGAVDTMARYIYIHGAPDSHPMGIPSSHGCIKMRNLDIIELYQRVSVGATVNIVYPASRNHTHALSA